MVIKFVNTIALSKVVKKFNVKYLDKKYIQVINNIDINITKNLKLINFKKY